MDTMHKTNYNTENCQEKFFTLTERGNFDAYMDKSGPDGKQYDKTGCRIACLGNLNNINYFTPLKDKFEVFQCNPKNYDLLQYSPTIGKEYLKTVQ